MSDYIENLYEVSQHRNKDCCIKDDIRYVKWSFPVAKGGLNPTYAEKVNKSILKNIVKETEDYKTVLLSPLESLHKKYPDELEFSEKVIVYGLEQEKVFAIAQNLQLKIVKSKDDLRLWGRVASKIYNTWDTDSIVESFKMDLRKKYATYFIFYKGSKPVGVSQVIRGAGCSAVYWIGVLDEYRKKGFGTEITKRTINYEIEHKRTKFVLTPSDLGLIIYRKLGFKPVDSFCEYKIKV